MIDSSDKKRHGCVTAWLILAIILNSISALIYLFAGNIVADNLPNGISTPILILLIIMGICNIVFSILILNWKKIGFWGAVLTGIAALIINLCIGIEMVQSLLGLIGIVILYGVLQIKKDNIAAWDYLE